MFDSKNRYITSGIESSVPLYLIMILWELIDREKQNTKLDYLQIFRLSKENGRESSMSRNNPSRSKRHMCIVCRKHSQARYTSLMMATTKQCFWLRNTKEHSLNLCSEGRWEYGRMVHSRSSRRTGSSSNS